MLAAGAPADVIAAARGAAHQVDDTDFEVWPENWEAVEVFTDLSTSWTWVTAGLATPVRYGIPATEIQASMRGLGMRRKARARTYRDVRLMESAALEELSK